MISTFSLNLYTFRFFAWLAISGSFADQRQFHACRREDKHKK